MTWYYIVLIVVGVLLLSLLVFLVCKTLWGHHVRWEGGFIGFLQAFDYVARLYAMRWHIWRPKPLKVLKRPNHKEISKDKKDKADKTINKRGTLSPEKIAEIERKNQEYAIIMQKEKEEEKKWDSENLFHARAALRINKSIPFNFDLGDSHKRLAIYYEQSYDENINNYIRTHYEELAHLFKSYSHDITFVYFPMMLENIQESIQYNNPDALIGDISHNTPESLYNIITENIVKIPTINPMILITDYYNSAGYPKEKLGDTAMSCFCIELEYQNDEQFSAVLQKHAKQFNHDYAVFYQIHTPKGKDVADGTPINEIAKEIQTRINQLYAMGVSEYVIGQIVSLPKPKLSQLLITEDFRIMLPDYNNMEIKMPTLSKTLFLFYLNHPEGVLFKELRDHKKELSEIYRSISPLEDMDKMKKSIEDIVDSTKNSVNEKCSRIRAAFVSQFNDNLAQNYYITGYAGKPKKIALDRSLVIDKSGLLKL